MENKLATSIFTTAITALFAITAQAQNLLQNGDFSAGNTGFTTGYAFIPSGISTTPGTFGIRSSSQDFNSGYNLFADHTTGTGLIMLVDGLPATIAWLETVPVATNTQYTFSIWATPSDVPNPAVLQFSINGNQIGSTLTLDQTPGVWGNFSYEWDSSTSTTAVLSIMDVNPSGQSYGDDFAIDDASFTEVVPEPSIWEMLAIGGAGLLFLGRRRAKA
jgi:hypothetical protein